MGHLDPQASKTAIDALRASSKPIADDKDVKARAKSAKAVKDTEAAVVKSLRDARAVVRGIKLYRPELIIKESASVVLLSREFQYPIQPSYENDIIGFMHNPTGMHGINIILRNGDTSNLP